MSTLKLYDYREDDTLCKLLERIKKEIRTQQKLAIYDACLSSDSLFRSRVQCSPLNGDNHSYMTMQELAEIRFNDPGHQQIDNKAVEKLFFGAYGFIKHSKMPDRDIINKLVIPPRIILFENSQGKSECPANGSGRHRNYALQMLCAASGVSWEDTMKQKIWVDKTIVSNKSEFEMAMTVSNGAGRKQSRMELTSYNLSTAGVSVDDAEQIIDTRFNVKKNQWPDFFANLVMQYVPKHSEHYKKDFFNRSRTAWYKTYRLNDINKNRLEDIYDNQPSVLQEIAKNIGENLYMIYQLEHKNTPKAVKRLTTRLNEATVDQICIAANLEKPVWETKQELIQKKLELNYKEKDELLIKQAED